VPLLRGPVDLTIDRFADYERLMTSNLDAWLCNMYFDVKPFETRFMDNQVEYAVAMEYTTKLVAMKMKKARMKALTYGGT
jgi:hypothetical protein